MAKEKPAAESADPPAGAPASMPTYVTTLKIEVDGVLYQKGEPLPPDLPAGFLQPLLRLKQAVPA